MRRAYGYGALLLLAAAVTGCGTDTGGSPPDPAPRTVADKGPRCVGSAPRDGLHVSLGGGYRLPGGGGVQYASAHADGTTRTAGLREGVTHEDGQRTFTAKQGQEVTVAGHAYTVSQICSYRLVLEPTAAADRAAAAALPKGPKPDGDANRTTYCFTTNEQARAEVDRGLPAKGGELALLDNGGRQSFPGGFDLAVYSVDGDAGTANLGFNCAGVTAGWYTDTAVGDPVEFAGVTFEVTSVKKHGAVRLTRTGS